MLVMSMLPTVLMAACCAQYACRLAQHAHASNQAIATRLLAACCAKYVCHPPSPPACTLVYAFCNSMVAKCSSCSITLWPYRLSRGAASAKALTAISMAPCSRAVCSLLGRSKMACSLNNRPRTCAVSASSVPQCAMTAQPCITQCITQG